MAKKIVCPRCQSNMRKLSKVKYSCGYCGVVYHKATPQSMFNTYIKFHLGKQSVVREVVFDE